MIVAFASVAHAQDNPTGFVPLAKTDSSRIGDIYQSGNLSTFVNGIFKLALTLGAILAILRLIYGGYLYMGRADMWSTAQHAREVIGDAVLGLLLLLAVYMVLYQINPDIVKLKAFESIQKGVGN